MVHLSWAFDVDGRNSSMPTAWSCGLGLSSACCEVSIMVSKMSPRTFRSRLNDSIIDASSNLDDKAESSANTEYEEKLQNISKN